MRHNYNLTWSRAVLMTLCNVPESRFMGREDYGWRGTERNRQMTKRRKTIITQLILLPTQYRSPLSVLFDETIPSFPILMQQLSARVKQVSK